MQTTKVEATLNLYSGLPNPTWTLDDSVALRLLARVRVLPHVLDGPITPPPARGYRGVIVTFHPGTEQAQTVRLFEQVVEFDKRILIDARRELEFELLSQSPALLELGVTASEIIGPYNEAAITGISGNADGTPCSTAPSFPSNVAIWRHNNCYSYANNKRNTSNQFAGAQPGGGSALTPAALIDAAEADGLDFLGDELPRCDRRRLNSHYFALCLMHFANGKVRDYHCIRLDRNGNWSHKNGPHDPVTNKDDKLNVMTDLKQAALFWNPSLVGFFRSSKAKRNIKFS